jgi:hypothetical protein
MIQIIQDCVISVKKLRHTKKEKVISLYSDCIQHIYVYYINIVQLQWNMQYKELTRTFFEISHIVDKNNKLFSPLELIVNSVMSILNSHRGNLLDCSWHQCYMNSTHQ